MIKKLIIFIATIALCTNSYSDDEGSKPLVEFLATYDASIKGFSVSAKRSLTKKTDNQYQLNFTADSLLASVSEQSTFTYNNTVVSQEYSYKQTGLGKKRERSLSFTSNDKLIQSFYKGKEKTFPYNEKTLDVLNYQLQLQLDISRGNTSGSYTVANKDSLKTYNYSVVGEEVFKTATGPLNTVKVTVNRDNDSKKTTFIWLAKDWNYLLVGLEQFEGDKKKLTIHLKQATVDKRSVSAL